MSSNQVTLVRKKKPKKASRPKKQGHKACERCRNA